MNFKTENIDMLHGPLLKKLILFTLPIAFSSILQQLFSAADTAVVGFFDSADSLAAVGTNTEIIALIVTVSTGMSIGANVLIAGLIGQNKKHEIPRAVQTAVVLSVAIGIMGLLLGQCIARPILRFIKTPQDILSSAEIYLRIYMLGYPFLLLYDFGSAVLRAKGDSRYPFISLAISGFFNVFLNLFFVIALHMGVVGVAVATDISNMLSAFLVLHRLKKDGQFSMSVKRSEISLRFTAEILKTGIPSALQGAVFCFANIFVQASVNGFGKTAIAGSTVAMNFEYFTYYIITAFGQTATTFTGQNHAAGQTARCKKILWLCLLLSTVCSSIPIFTIVLGRSFFCSFFTSDQAVIQSASVRILCILLFEPICNFFEIPAGALRGSGHAVYPAVGTMLGTCAFRIIWIFTVFKAYPTLSVLYCAFPISWIITILFIDTGFLLIKHCAATGRGQIGSGE